MPSETESIQTNLEKSWPLGRPPRLGNVIPSHMQALTLHRDQYGPPVDVLAVETIATPQLGPMDATQVLVSVLATGPNFNTNFAALGLPVPVFGRGDSATLHIPGSDALGIVVDAGTAVTRTKVGQAVIIDSWTGNSIRGYETHDGFNAQFVKVDEHRIQAVPPELMDDSPERLAAMLLTYGTAYRAIVERLVVKPGDSLLVMGGGKGTSFAGAQIGKAMGARVILVGSNPELAADLIERGIADTFVNRRSIPASAYGEVQPDESWNDWQIRSKPFRDAVLAANQGQPIDKIFEHTGGGNFPLLTSVLSDHGIISFFGATGQGLRGEYRETFFYDQKRFVMDARWVWMRQKLVICRNAEPGAIFDEIRLPPGRRGLIWGADEYARSFAVAALERGARLVILASFSKDRADITKLKALGVTETDLIDLDRFDLNDDMPDPLTEDGTPNDDYHQSFMLAARSVGKAIWSIFGPRISPDFIVDRPDQSRLHFSTFLLRDFDEDDALPSAYVLMKGSSNCSILGSHMYRATQAVETIRLLANRQIVMEQDDLEVVALPELPQIQQKMLDGTMTKPKGVALVQANTIGRSLKDYEDAYLGDCLIKADPAAQQFMDVRLCEDVALLTLTRPDALNALSDLLINQLGSLVDELEQTGAIRGRQVKALIVTGAGRSFVAGADIEVFIGKTSAQIEQLAKDNMAVFTGLENLSLPVISLIDGFALGGGNELALSTHYRILTENAQLGQPEVKLGIIPGYGGMQRLPRRIGPRLALQMAVNGESLDSETAISIGLADEYQSSATALARAFQVAREFIDGVRQFEKPDWNGIAQSQQAAITALEKDPSINAFRNAVAPASDQSGDLQSARRYAAHIALQAMLEGYACDFDRALANDARLFGEVVTSPSGQEWCKRFLSKDSAQSSFLTQMPEPLDEQALGS